jgi:hypothetical protein
LTTGPDWGTGEELYIQFAVQDTGPGLTVEEKKILFKRFTQASPRTHVQYGGSGLGLFISRELAELQGGEIGVASEAGKGSTFAFYIKSRRSKKPDNPELAIPALLKTVDSRVRKSERGATSTKRERNNISLLIVEDNLVNQRVLQKQLQHLGFDTHVANHGGEALDILRESRFWKGNAMSDLTATGKRPINITVVLMDQEVRTSHPHPGYLKIRKLMSFNRCPSWTAWNVHSRSDD